MGEDRFNGFFIGRDGELGTFRDMLDDPTGKPWALFVQGPGGIGKTWLMKHMLGMAEKVGFFIPAQLVDMYSTDNQHVEGLINTLVERLSPLFDETSFAEVREAQSTLESARATEGYSAEGIENRLTELKEAFHRSLQAIGEDTPLVIPLDTFEHVQNGPVGKWVLSDEGLLMPGAICLIASRQPLGTIELHRAVQEIELSRFNDEEAMDLYYSYTRSEDERTDEQESYVSIVNELADGNPLLLGLAFQWLPPGMSSDELEEMSQEDFERDIMSWLDPVGGSGLYFTRDSDLDEPLRETFVYMSYLNRRFNRFFLEHLVEHGYVRLGDVTLDRVWKHLSRGEPDFFFVKERPEGQIQLHDILAEMLRLYQLPFVFEDLTGDDFRQFARDVVDWYDELIEISESDIEKDVLRAERLAYVLQLDVWNDFQRHDFQSTTLYSEGRASYPLQPDYEQAKALLGDYDRVHSMVLDRLLVEEMRPSVVEQFSSSDQYEIYTRLGRIAARAYQLEQASVYWERAFEVASEADDPPRQIQALIGLHNSTWQKDPEESLDILKQALEICSLAERMRPQVLYEIGFTHRRMENLEKAIEWYQEAKEAAADYRDKEMMPTILNDMGFAYLLVGDQAQAESLIETASRQRQRRLDALREQRGAAETEEQKEELESQVYDAALKLGMSYTTLGQLARFRGDMATATGYYSEASSIFVNADAYVWLTGALCSRGEAHRRIAKTLYGQGRRESSQRYDERAQEDIQASINLCEKYGFTQYLDTAYRRLGRLFHDRGAFRTEGDPGKQIELLDEALEYFERAFQIARETGDALEELECLTEIAFLADDRMRILRRYDTGRAEEEEGKLREYIERLRQGIEAHRDDDPRIYQFPVFENLLRIEEGAFAFALGDHDGALGLYVDGYVGMAQDPGYGSARYREHVDHLFENIRRLDDERREKWCERFRKEWETRHMLRVGRSQTLAEAHPGMLHQIDLHLTTDFMYE